MAEIVKPDMTALWASGGAVVAPTNNKIKEGWNAEVPPHQWENFVQLRQDEAIAYLFQRGIAEWDNSTEYFANKSVVLYNGILYIAIDNNQNVDPANTARWKPITGNATTSVAGLMSPADKLKLDGIEAGAQKNVVLSVSGKVGAVTLNRSDVGLGNVDNTSDSQKPLSNAAISALNTKAPVNSPTFTGTVRGITKSMVGLGNVDNTSDLSKPISTATQTALNSKANTHNTTFTGTVSGITKGMVGLGDVDNTSDLNKPVSTATQAAIDAINTSLNSKANTSTQIITGTGLTGGGNLSTNRTLNVVYGTTAGTAAQGNDSRITGAAQKSSNLSDLTNKATARSNLGLGNAATRNVGLGSGELLANENVLTLTDSSRDATSIVAGDDISWGWNHPSNYSLKLTNNNNCLAILVGHPINQRIVTIQSGHTQSSYGSSVGILDLNPVGGEVRVNRNTVYHTGNLNPVSNGKLITYSGSEWETSASGSWAQAPNNYVVTGSKMTSWLNSGGRIHIKASRLKV